MKNHDILNYDALHFKLARSVLKIASFKFAKFKYSRTSRKHAKDMWSLTGGGRLPKVRPQGSKFLVI